ncbi:hypothetical protein SARC_03410 [Sphaeroforma arctica JP610]|uniref:Methyltransferase small domain-containing protein n=1 Tax=Sphaeroforma arctica JP610 TaxID=667725 RepID=A0A0L0G5R3_9EUKA|nr:hypothetical protein SARC_03410 [Sphaeroforma arctica JP610]KNC84365.1 hypothetical protein SARC_03410 [Sphaeroforma arctica JP610]|eukprot:XP_014158267.1 hypothetical protein SARC_03410 [Sphaeroforma arctica JP610]
MAENMETNTVTEVLLLPPPPSLTYSPLFLGVLLADRSVYALLEVCETLPKSTIATLTTIADKQESISLYFVVSGGRTQASACLLATEYALEVKLGAPLESFASFTKINLEVYINEYGIVSVSAAEEVGLGVTSEPTELIFDLQNPTTCRPDFDRHESTTQLYDPALVRRLPIKLPHRTIAVLDKVYTIKQQFTGDVPVSQHDLTGCALWESGIIAAHFLPQVFTTAYRTTEDNKASCHGNDTLSIGSSGRRMRVLEIGCGAGLVSTVVADQCPFIDIVGTDGEELALRLSAENARRNGVSVVESLDVCSERPELCTLTDDTVFCSKTSTEKPSIAKVQRRTTILCQQGRVMFARLDWNDACGIQEFTKQLGPFDFIIGSDLVYPAAPIHPLLNVLKSTMTKETTAYIVTKNRTGEGDEFVDNLSTAKWVKNLTIHGADVICDEFRTQQANFRSVSFKAVYC